MAIFPTSLPSGQQFNPFAEGDAIQENAPAFVITELAGEKRRLVLRSRALPYAGVSWGGSMRTRITWYQGNPVATQQVLGPEEAPTTVEGKWKDRFIRGAVQQYGFPREVAFATDLVEFFDSLRVSGQVLEVVWGLEVRRGILVDFEATYDRLQDIAWKAEFEWQGRGPVTPRVPEEPEPPASILDRINAVADTFALGPDFLFPDLNAVLVSTIAEAREKTATVFEGLRATQRAASVPADVLGATAAAVESLRAEFLDEVTTLAEAPVQLVSTSQRVADQLSVEAWRRDMEEAFSALLDGLQRARERLERRAEPPATQVFQVRADMTLYTVSQRFYETPDFAGFLQDVNLLDSVLVEAGTTLVIPPKPESAGA